MSTNKNELKAGDKLSEHQYYTVLSTTAHNIEVLNDKGETFTISKAIVEKDMYSADQHSATVKLSRTEIIDIIKNTPETVMTIHFRKKVKNAEALAQMKELYANKGGTIISKAVYDRKCAAILDTVTLGEPRTIVGRHHGAVTEQGRIQFVDMELERDASKTYDTRYRQVDPRTIEWVIVKNTKYVVK